MKFHHSVSVWGVIFLFLEGTHAAAINHNSCRRPNATVSGDNAGDAATQAKNVQYAMNLNGVQWDKSCAQPNPNQKGETRQDAVMHAWAGALELASDAWDRYNTITYPKLKEDLPYYLRIEINQNDPAYTEYLPFSAGKKMKDNIKDVLHSMRYEMNADKDKHNLVISCYAPSDQAEAKDGCTGDVAYTVNLQDKSYINFCPMFFQLPRFADWKKAATAQSPNEKGVGAEKFQAVRNITTFDMGSDAAAVFREASHLSLLGRTTRSDVLISNSWWQTADNSAKAVGDNAYNQLAETADNYGWYAEYGYFSRLAGVDIWPDQGPATITKPVKPDGMITSAAR